MARIPPFAIDPEMAKKYRYVRPILEHGGSGFTMRLEYFNHPTNERTPTMSKKKETRREKAMRLVYEDQVNGLKQNLQKSERMFDNQNESLEKASAEIRLISTAMDRQGEKVRQAAHTVISINRHLSEVPHGLSAEELYRRIAFAHGAVNEAVKMLNDIAHPAMMASSDDGVNRCPPFFKRSF